MKDRAFGRGPCRPNSTRLDPTFDPRLDSTRTSAIIFLCVPERHDASGLAISCRGTGVGCWSFAGSRRHPRIEAALSGAKGRATEANLAQPRIRAAASNVGHIEPAGWYRIIYPRPLMAPRRSITDATNVFYPYVM